MSEEYSKNKRIALVILILSEGNVVQPHAYLPETHFRLIKQ